MHFRYFTPMRILIFSLVLALLAACDQAGVLERFAQPEEQALAKGYVDRLRARDFESIEKVADPAIRGPGMRETLEKMAGFFPAQEPRSIELVGAHKNVGGGVSSLNTTFEYEFAETWLIVNVVVQERAGAKTITGFNVYPRTRSLESENRFTLSGKQPVHYMVLGWAIVAVVLSLYALVVCGRTPGLKRKPLWILFILIGIGKFAVNWTSGESTLQPLSIQLLSASAFAPLHGPWIVSVSVPVGAVAFFLYLWTRHHRRPENISHPGEH